MYLLSLYSAPVRTYGLSRARKAETFGKFRLRPSAPKAEKPKPKAELRPAGLTGMHALRLDPTYASSSLDRALYSKHMHDLLPEMSLAP